MRLPENPSRGSGVLSLSKGHAREAREVLLQIPVLQRREVAAAHSAAREASDLPLSRVSRGAAHARGAWGGSPQTPPYGGGARAARQRCAASFAPFQGSFDLRGIQMMRLPISTPGVAGAQPMRGGFGGCLPSFHHSRERRSIGSGVLSLSKGHALEASWSSPGFRLSGERKSRVSRGAAPARRAWGVSPQALALDLLSRVSRGAAPARGAWGVSPQIPISLGVGAEQRDSDAQQVWQPTQPRTITQAS